MSNAESTGEKGQAHSGPPKWVIVVAVILMLAGIAAYVLSLDEAIEPSPDSSGGGPGLPTAPPVPQVPPASPVPKSPTPPPVPPISPGAPSGGAGNP